MNQDQQIVTIATGSKWELSQVFYTKRHRYSKIGLKSIADGSLLDIDINTCDLFFNPA